MAPHMSSVPKGLFIIGLNKRWGGVGGCCLTYNGKIDVNIKITFNINIIITFNNWKIKTCRFLNTITTVVTMSEILYEKYFFFFRL